MTTRAALYARQSRTRGEGDERSASTDDQLRALRELAQRRGWTVAGEYIDQDAPADRLDRRGEWLRLLADAQAFDVVAAYDTSRLWRNVEARYAATRQLHAAGVEAVATLGGDTPTDPTGDPQGAFVGTIMVAVAEYDNALRAAKVRTAMARLKRDGQAHGGGNRLYGYSRDRSVLVEHEAARLRAAVEQITRGASVGSVASGWNDDGATTTRGNRWSRITLTRLLRNRALSGWRDHAAGVRGDWPQILTDDEHERLIAALDRRAARHGRTTTAAATRPLSGLLVCTLCGGLMYSGRDSRGVPRYRCRRDANADGCGRQSVKAADADAEVVARVLARLDASTGVVQRHLAAATDADERLREATADLARLDERRRELGALYADGTVDAATLAGATARLEQRERQARATLDATSGATSVLTDAARDPARWWDGASLVDRRALLDVLIARVECAPATRGRFDPQRLRVVWRDA